MNWTVGKTSRGKQTAVTYYYQYIYYYATNTSRIPDKNGNKPLYPAGELYLWKLPANCSSLRQLQQY